MSGRDDVSNEYLLHSLAQGEVSPEVAAATSLTVEVRQLRAERTTPAPSSGAGLDLGALHETICDKFTGMAEVRQAADLLVAEVRRLTEDIDQCWVPLYHDTKHERDQAEARAEAAEAEVVTLRARLAAVEAWPLTLEQVHAIVDYLLGDGSRDGLIHGDTLNRAMGASARRRAALAVTTGEGE